MLMADMLARSRPRVCPCSSPPPLSSPCRFLMAYFLVACIAAYQMSSAWYVGHHDVDIATRQLLAGFLGVLLVLVLGLAYKSGGLSSQYSHEQPAAEQTHHPR